MIRLSRILPVLVLMLLGCPVSTDPDPCDAEGIPDRKPSDRVDEPATSFVD